MFSVEFENLQKFLQTFDANFKWCDLVSPCILSNVRDTKKSKSILKHFRGRAMHLQDVRHHFPSPYPSEGFEWRELAPLKLIFRRWRVKLHDVKDQNVFFWFEVNKLSWAFFSSSPEIFRLNKFENILNLIESKAMKRLNSKKSKSTRFGHSNLGLQHLPADNKMLKLWPSGPQKRKEKRSWKLE